MKAITANRLIDGEVVFWKAGAWVEGFGDAQLFDDAQDAEVETVVAAAKAQPTVIVDPYPIDLAPVDGGLALMDLGTRSASVVAEEDCRAIEIGAADLLQLYEHDVEQFALVQMNIGREVCRRLRAIDERLFRERLGESPLSVEILFGAGRG